MKIKVTIKDIMLGKRQSAASCPVARGIRRQTKARMVSVSDKLYINKKVVNLPVKVNDFIYKYDNWNLDKNKWNFDKNKFRPFSFNLKYEN